MITTLKQPRVLRGMFPLKHNIKIYLPNTRDGDKPADTRQLVKRTLVIFSKYFGGATTYAATGAWLSNKYGLITEKVNIVESYSSEDDLEDGLLVVLDHAKAVKGELLQEAIAIEFNNALYFV